MASSSSASVVSNLRERGAQVFELSRRVLLSDQWRLVSRSPRGDVHTMVEPNIGRIYMVTVIIDTPASRLRKILIDWVESYPKWCSIYAKDSCKRVMDLDDGIDVTYAVTQARLGGLVAPRDWLTLRVWGDHTDSQGRRETLSTGVAVQLPEYPPGHKCVRGETLLGAYSITDLGEEGGVSRCRFRFLSAVRLGGWLPRSITELYVTDGIVEFAEDVRRRACDADP